MADQDIKNAVRYRLKNISSGQLYQSQGDYLFFRQGNIVWRWQVAQSHERHEGRHLPISGRVGDTRPISCIGKGASTWCADSPASVFIGRRREIWR